VSRARRRSMVKSPSGHAEGGSSAGKRPKKHASPRKKRKNLVTETAGPKALEGAESAPGTYTLFTLPENTKPPETPVDASGLYDPEDIVDAPEHHALSKALGILTWDIWDHGVRPVTERKRDFVTAFPPRNPTAYSLGGMEHRTDHEWIPRTRAREMERFLSREATNGIDRLLARYGLKLKGASPLQLRTTPVRDPIDAARERNHALRVLYGSVDIEPKDMDTAKSAFLEHQERRRAAEEIRAARKRLQAESKDDEVRKP
jgi:hypothetical protein